MIPYFIIEVYPKLYLVCEFKKNKKKKIYVSEWLCVSFFYIGFYI